MRLSLRLVDFSSLPVDTIPGGKLACGSGGLTVVVVEVQIDPVLRRDARGASSVLVSSLEVLEADGFERELPSWRDMKKHGLVSASEDKIPIYTGDALTFTSPDGGRIRVSHYDREDGLVTLAIT